MAHCTHATREEQHTGNDGLLAVWAQRFNARSADFIKLHSADGTKLPIFTLFGLEASKPGDFAPTHSTSIGVSSENFLLLLLPLLLLLLLLVLLL
jgi:hypothetical protein